MRTEEEAQRPEICADCGFEIAAGHYTACEGAAEYVCDGCRGHHLTECEACADPELPQEADRGIRGDREASLASEGAQAAPCAAWRSLDGWRAGADPLFPATVFLGLAALCAGILLYVL
jgi:hypothetical protein